LPGVRVRGNGSRSQSSRSVGRSCWPRSGAFRFAVGRRASRARLAPTPPPRPDQLGLATYIIGILIYVLIAALAFTGGLAALRTEAILLTLLLFLGFNVAWLLLFDDRYPAHGRPPATAL